MPHNWVDMMSPNTWTHGLSMGSEHQTLVLFQCCFVGNPCCFLCRFSCGSACWFGKLFGKKSENIQSFHEVVAGRRPGQNSFLQTLSPREKIHVPSFHRCLQWEFGEQAKWQKGAFFPFPRLSQEISCCKDYLVCCKNLNS